MINPPIMTDAQRLAADIGLRLLWAREALQLSHMELAIDVGVNEAAIRHIEKGRRGPSLPLIATLCHTLRITPQYLFYGDVRDIDPELRRALLVRHPELRTPSMPRPAGKRSSSSKNTAPRPRMELAT